MGEEGGGDLDQKQQTPKLLEEILKQHSPPPGGGAESFLASSHTQEGTLFGVLLTVAGMLSLPFTF